MTNGTITGRMAVNQEHEINPKILDNAIAAFEAAATRFSIDAISDAKVRQNYMSNIKRISNEIKSLVDSKKITVKEGAEFCYEMRNKIMAEARTVTSPQALSIAEKKKKLPPTMEEILNKKANEIYKKDFSKLETAEKQRIYYRTIESAGRDNAAMTTKVKRLRVIGKVCLLATAAIATYSILNADNKQKEAVKQGFGIGGGLFGGFLAGLTVSTICGPGAPVCAVAIVLMGSLAGGGVGAYVAETLDNELEEFTKWNLK